MSIERRVKQVKPKQERTIKRPDALPYVETKYGLLYTTVTTKDKYGRVYKVEKTSLLKDLLNSL